ncbi:MAG: hypothetical protein GF364_13735 [Candidatus Lokiarchaeota archaeon]|nr:hypothetical protein [Candidatus Lokiarchaeota archaeon]
MSGWSDFWATIGELFGIPVGWDVYTVGMIIIFGAFTVLGYQLISKQIKLVKAEIFSWSDYIKCIIYSIIFASGFTIIMLIMLIFAWETKSIPFLIPITGDISALLLWLVGFVIAILYIYPIFDLLYLAHSKENKGLTIFQEFVADKFIHRVDRPLSYLVALGVYALLYVLPTMIGLIIGFPAIVVTITVAIYIPVIIINYFGVLGYIAGVVQSYYDIPVIPRSSFLFYGRHGRLDKELTQDNYSGILTRAFWGLQIFLYFYLIYSFLVTMSKLFAPEVQAVQTVFQWQVFISLFFGIWGYFSRFWYRKMKFRWMDILFSAWLVAVTGLNVMVNYILTNSGIFFEYFNKWSVTSTLFQTNWFKNGNFLLLGPIAVVEELTIVGLITYYVLSKRSDFFKNTKLSLVDSSAQTFKPVPLFNLIRVSEDEIRNHAKEELQKMYERIPYKKDVNLLDDKYMNPLFDAICDWNKNSHQMGISILKTFILNYPEKISPKINETLLSDNYDKKLPVAQLVLENPEKITKHISVGAVNALIEDSDYHCREIGTKLIANYVSDDELINKEQVVGLLDDPDYVVQAEALKIISKYKIEVDPSILFRKMTHKNEKIKSGAVLAVSTLGDFDSRRDGRKMVKSLVNMLTSAEGEIEASILTSLGRIGNFKRNKIPFEPILEGIYDQSPKVRTAARRTMQEYVAEYKKSRKTEKIFDRLVKELPKVDNNVKLTIFRLMENIWYINPEAIVPELLKSIKSKDNELKNTVSQAIVNIGADKPQLVLKNLLETEEEKTYLKEGIISETTAKIFSKNKKLLNLVYLYLKKDNINIRKNMASALNSLAEKYPEDIDIKKIITILIDEKNPDVKKEILKFLSNFTKIDPERIGNEIDQLIQILQDDDRGVRLAALKMLVPLSKYASKSIPLEYVTVLLNDQDPFIRESAIKIIGNLKSLKEKQIKTAYYMLKELLNDGEWAVKNAAMSAIKDLGLKSGDKEILNKIIELTNDEEKYTRMKALEIVAELVKTSPELVSVKKQINPLINDKDPEIRKLVAKIAGSYGEDHFKDVFPIILKLMKDENKQVRERAQNALVTLSAQMSIEDLYPPTLKYFSDETDILLQQSMALALKRIVKYENKSTRQRLIDILRIRCEISQDPIICQVLQDLKAE